MKRRIEDLGLHEAIHLIADKYSKNVCKNAKRENMNYGYIIRDFYRDNFFSWVRDIEGRYPIITAVYPASEFKNKPKKLRLDKIEERLTKLENSQPLSVTDNGNGDYTITGDLFKAKVKETAIDWSRAGQLVISDDIVIETTGLHSSDAFSGVVVLGNNSYKRGHAINRWNKSKFKPYTGKI